MLSNKPYIETYKKKLKRYNFTAILEEPTYGEEIVKSELSQGAYELITEWQRDIYFNKEFLRDYFELRKFPISEKVINFFCIYGGRNFCFENDLLFNNTIQINGGYIIQSFPIHADEKNGNLYYDCMDYHYAGDWGPHIDQDGRIYSFGMGEYYKQADNIAEFMDQQWLKAVANKEKLKHIINSTEEKKHYLHNRNIKRKDNIFQNVYEYLISYCIPEKVKIIEPLMLLILEKKISLNDEQVNALMEEFLINENISEELIMDIVEFLSIQNITLKTILTMVDVVSKVTLKERKERFFIDKLIQWEDDYPEVKNNIMNLL
ncbi:hypothetical protein [Clostridium saccharoperbutylacetonicum]|uniref:hypothetical protein n=1 Tax=Clostridium saccharoperbutylacetonicum TaxID=36745 RepID=UPI0009838C49|nr:hypothetical protein [Clostridium saccharoperbutylacetonicum]AQR95946.1 hypothetical protein CLSAP_32640 [Clostridium saccharoperbutylacetonicum]NSB31813.1 hypothetical protein [Clostridium saccharoperbutylacetonicum]